MQPGGPPPVMAQDYMDPTQAGAINAMTPGPQMAGAPPMPGEQGGMNPVAQLLAQAADMIVQRGALPEDAAAVEQFLQFILSLQPQGPGGPSQPPVEQGMAAAPQGPAPLPGGAPPMAAPMPSNGGSPTPLPLPQR